MRIYEGSPRQDFEEVFRSIGAFLDQRGMREILLVEAPDGFIVQGLVIARRIRRRLVRLDRARRSRRRSRSSTTTSRGSWTRRIARRGQAATAAAGPGRLLRDGVPGARPVHGRAEAAGRLLLRAGRRVRAPPADERRRPAAATSWPSSPGRTSPRWSRAGRRFAIPGQAAAGRGQPPRSRTASHRRMQP